MLQKINQHIAENFSFFKNKKLLIAISGGIDSTVLTYLLHKLNFNISLAHCNFCLRGKESDLDEKFVVSLAEKLHIPVFVKKMETEKYAKKHKLSIQEAARNLRYDWFKKLAKKNNIDYILTAHNLNDSLETVLFNLTRSTGLTGLTGISAINGILCRPLLPFSRKEITNFAKENNIIWREDISNANTKYTRNKIRHKIIPVLSEINNNLLESFKNTQQYLQDADAIIQQQVNLVKNQISETENNMVKFDVAKMQQLSQKSFYIYQIFKAYNFTEFKDIEQLLIAQSGKQVFSKTHRLLKDRNFLLLIKKAENTINTNLEFKILATDTVFRKGNLHLKIEHLDHTNNQKTDKKDEKSIIIDKDLLKFPLTVRKWKNGDYFYPIGMQGKKKVSKYFKDEKLSLYQKENIWLLLSDNKIIWIINMRQDKRFKTQKNTKNSIKISIKE